MFFAINASRCSIESVLILLCNECFRLILRYQYCWFCRIGVGSHRPWTILWKRQNATMTAAYRRRVKNVLGRHVCTAWQSGHRYRFTHVACEKPSKYRSTKPCPHNLLPLHCGHSVGFGHGYPFPCSYKSFTSTAKCSINKLFWGDNQEGVLAKEVSWLSLFLWDIQL